MENGWFLKLKVKTPLVYFFQSFENAIRIAECRQRVKTTRNILPLPRDHEASPYSNVVRDHFDEFERVFPERVMFLKSYT